MLNEQIHQTLKEVYDEFDRHARITNTNYSIDADYPTIQSYRIITCPDIQRFVRHIANFVKTMPIKMSINDKDITYDDLNLKGFRYPIRRNNLIQFSLEPLKEKNMKTCKTCKKEIADTTKQVIIDNENYHKKCRPSAKSEDQYHYPEASRKGKLNPRGRASLRKQKGAYTYEDFANKLDKIIDENVELGFKEPEILFSINDTPSYDLSSQLESIKTAHENIINNCLFLMENSDDVITLSRLEDMIEHSNTCLNYLKDIKLS